MAHTLRIRRIQVDGTTADGLDFGATLLDYEPFSEDMQVVLENPNATLVESAQFLLTAANTAALQAAINTIQTAFVDARSREANRAGDRIYLLFQPDGAANPYRSPIVDGKVAIGPEGLDWMWVGLKVEVLITWTRRAWWERADSLIELPLSNGNGTNQTGGLGVYNHDDGTAGHDNFVQIGFAGASGILPAPAQLRIYNDSGGDIGGDIYVYQAILNDVANFPHILEGENGSAGAGVTGTVQSGDASMSNGGDMQLVFSGITEQILVAFSLSSALLNAARGRFYQLVARIVPITGAINQIKLRIMITNTNVGTYAVFYLGPQMRPQTNSGNLYILGTIQIPPGSFIYSTGLVSRALILSVQCDDGAGRTIKLDYLQLSPVDGWRLYKPNTVFKFPNGKDLWDDGVEFQMVYQVPHGSTYSEGNFYKAYGRPLMIYPDSDRKSVV